MQDMLSHGLGLNVQALSCVVQALQVEGLVWKALDLLILTHQVKLCHSLALAHIVYADHTSAGHATAIQVSWTSQVAQIPHNTHTRQSESTRYRCNSVYGRSTAFHTGYLPRATLLTCRHHLQSSCN